MKKTISLLCSMLLCISLLAGCAPKTTVTGLALAETSVTLEVGDTTSIGYALTLTAGETSGEISISPDGEYTPSENASEAMLQVAQKQTYVWAISDERVASIDSETGLVTPLAGGKATLTLTIGEGETALSASAELVVLPPLERIYTAEDAITLQPEETHIIQWEQQPKEATASSATFTSDNEEVAIVDKNGVVTALANGTAVITITVQDSKKKDFTTALTLTVETPPESIAFEQSEGILTKGQSYTPSYAINPETVNVSYSVLWASSNEAVATVNTEGKMTALAAGTATITVTVADESGTALLNSEGAEITASYTLTVKNPAPPKQTTPAGGAGTTPTGGGSSAGGTGNGEAGANEPAPPPPSYDCNPEAAIAWGYEYALSRGMVYGTGGGSYNAPISAKISTEAMIAGIKSEVDFHYAAGGEGVSISIYRSGDYIVVAGQ